MKTKFTHNPFRTYASIGDIADSPVWISVQLQRVGRNVNPLVFSLKRFYVGQLAAVTLIVGGVSILGHIRKDPLQSQLRRLRRQLQLAFQLLAYYL